MSRRTARPGNGPAGAQRVRAPDTYGHVRTPFPVSRVSARRRPLCEAQGLSWEETGPGFCRSAGAACPHGKQAEHRVGGSRRRPADGQRVLVGPGPGPGRPAEFAVGTRPPGRRRPRGRDGRRPLRLHPHPPADAGAGRTVGRSGSEPGDRELRGIPGRRACRYLRPAAGAFPGRAARLSARAGGHPGGDAADPQRRHLAAAPSRCGFLQRDDLRDRRQFPAQPPA